MRLQRLTTPPVIVTTVAAAVVALTLSTSTAAPAIAPADGFGAATHTSPIKTVATASQWNAAWRASPQAPSAGEQPGRRRV